METKNHVLNFRKKFVLFDQQKDEHFYFKEEQHDILRNEIISTILKHKATLVYIKPHPRQKIGVLKAKLKKYPKERVIFRNEPPMVMVIYCIPIILGESSVCLDCCRMGQVAIQYYRDEAEGFTHRFEKVGIVAVAHNPDELIKHVRELYDFDLNGMKPIIRVLG